jgi:hypothetical protein
MSLVARVLRERTEGKTTHCAALEGKPALT